MSIFDVLKKQLLLILFIVIIFFALITYFSLHDIKFDKKDDKKLVKVVTVEAYDQNNL